MQTWQAINGFIAGDPTISHNNDGDARLYIRIGINHFEKLEGGSYRKLAPTYHDLVQFGRGAELSHERFRRGDDFIAQGYVREYTRTVDGGEQRTSEQFVAHRLVHDPHTTTYEIHRKPRGARRDSTEPTRADTEHEPAASEPASTTPRPATPPSPPGPVPPPPPTTDAMTR